MREDLDLLRAALAERILAAKGHESILDALVQAAVEVVQADAAELFLLDESTNELVCETVLGGGAHFHERVPASEGIPGLVVATRQPMIVSNDPGIPHRSDWAPHHVLCVPLLTASERVLGALALFNAAPEACFASEDLLRVAAFCHVAVVAIEESRAHANFATLMAGREQAGARLDAASRTTSELADLVASFAQRGEAERALATNVLRAVDQYLAQREMHL